MVTSTVKCLYRFFFRLEDEEGKQLVISVADEEVLIFNPCFLRDINEGSTSVRCYRTWRLPISAMIQNPWRRSKGVWGLLSAI